MHFSFKKRKHAEKKKVNIRKLKIYGI